MKTTVNIDTQEEVWQQLRSKGPGGAELRRGVHACVEDPSKVAKIVEALVQQPEPAAGKMIHSTAQVEVEDILQLDKIAARMESTRNKLLQLIMRGILAGVI